MVESIDHRRVLSLSHVYCVSFCSYMGYILLEVALSDQSSSPSYCIRISLRVRSSDGKDLDGNHSRMEETSLLFHGNQRIIYLMDFELVVCLTKC